MSTTGTGPDLAGTAAGGRRLIAVVYADMVGYSRLIGLDDAGTLRRLHTLRETLIDPAIHEHGGRVVQTGGDSLLVAFDSIDGAVRCAMKVQQQVPAYDADQPPDRRIRFRMGINIGDVIPDGTNLHGEGVNIAARLEALCPPGGICVSQTVRDHVHGRLNLSFEPIGELALKNISRPVHAFTVRLDSSAAVSHAATRALFFSRVHFRVDALFDPRFAVAAALVLCAAIMAGYWIVRGNTRLPAPPEAIAVRQPASIDTSVGPLNMGLAKAPRLSLVVLPLSNLGGEGITDETVDAITEDLTNDLSRAWGLFVIGRSSAFTYKGKPIDIRRLGEELGVRYAVEGSVRKFEGTLRVNAQLLSTETGAQIWADHFGVERDGLSYTVDDIVRQIAAAMHAGVVESESARGARERPTNPDVADLVLRARSLNNLPQNSQRSIQKIELLERAVELDPFSAAALAGLAEALLDSITTLANDPTAPDKLRRAEDLVRRAEELRPNDMLVMFAKVFLLGMRSRCSEVVPAAQRAISAYPNLNSTHNWLGICLMFDGKAAEAIPEFEQSVRLNPRNAYVWNRYHLIGYALLFLDRYQEAILWFKKSIAATPNDNARRSGNTIAAIAAAQALAGQVAEAHSSGVEATSQWPTITVRSYYPYKVTNSVNAAQVSHMRSGLGRAGIRDHADENADSGITPDNVLHSDYEAPTPTSVPGAQTIKTAELNALIEQRKPLLLDVSLPWGSSIPGAVGLWGAGIGGNTFDQFQQRLNQAMQQLTHDDRATLIVTIGWNSERYQGRNLALRLVALGYTQVYWYRGGREAWEVAELPEAELALRDW